VDRLIFNSIFPDESALNDSALNAPRPLNSNPVPNSIIARNLLIDLKNPATNVGSKQSSHTFDVSNGYTSLNVEQAEILSSAYPGDLVAGYTVDPITKQKSLSSLTIHLRSPLTISLSGFVNIRANDITLKSFQQLNLGSLSSSANVVVSAESINQQNDSLFKAINAYLRSTNGNIILNNAEASKELTIVSSGDINGSFTASDIKLDAIAAIGSEDSPVFAFSNTLQANSQINVKFIKDKKLDSILNITGLAVIDSITNLPYELV
jgi:hypothetical protein